MVAEVRVCLIAACFRSELACVQISMHVLNLSGFCRRGFAQDNLISRSSTAKLLSVEAKGTVSRRAIWLGVLIEPVALVLAALSSFGQGTYLTARLLFPFSMLGTLIFDDHIAPPLLVLALLQFPIYGLAIGLARPARVRRVVAITIVVAHLIAAGAAFSGVLPKFS